MTYFILFLLFMLMIYIFTLKGNAVGTIPLGKVQSISYSQSFFINYTHIKTNKHSILLGHKMTNIKEGDELLMKRFQFKKMICNLSRKSNEYAIESVNLLDSLHDFIASTDPEKIMAYTKEKQNAIKLKK